MISAVVALSTPPLMATTTVLPAPSRGPIFSSLRRKSRSGIVSTVGDSIVTDIASSQEDMGEVIYRRTQERRHPVGAFAPDGRAAARQIVYHPGVSGRFTWAIPHQSLTQRVG